MAWMRRMAVAAVISAVGLLAAADAATADVKLATVFGDDMVLQCDMKLPVWGWAEPGEKVAVTVADQKLQIATGTDGCWRVTLEPLKAGGPIEMTVAGKNTIAIKDVLVGEVWVCSGQSNMEMGVGGVDNAKDEIAKADDPKMRLFTVKKANSLEPQKDCQGKWVACTPQTVGGFSAAAYFFGRDLRKKLDVPIGLVHSSWGGTVAEAWTSRAGLEAVAELKPILDRAKPEKVDQNTPTALWNAMIQPLVPMGMRGVIWYQGESNAGRAYQYRKLFPAMIADWRKQWGQGDFPFLFVQLANFGSNPKEPAQSDWAELREAQLMTLALPKTGMAVIIDIGNPGDIHPKNKQEVGHRLAVAAEKVAYDRKVEWSGPIYESMKVEDGGKVRVKFTHAGGGLKAGKAPDEKLAGFAIAGEDKKFVWAEARIDGDSVIVSSDKVAKPVAVRYGWANSPECNLYNQAGLPASPFRTDDWPGVTVNNK